tara:strand:- start:1309 stop:1566 length:258 start_codon:yes stop_codon:yes gene_type:complete
MLKLSYKCYELKEFNKTEFNIYHSSNKEFLFNQNVPYRVAVRKMRQLMVNDDDRKALLKNIEERDKKEKEEQDAKAKELINHDSE